MLGIVAVPVFATPVLAVLVLIGVQALERSTFVWLKAGLAAVEAGVVTPLIALAVLSDVALSRAASAAE